MQVQGLCVVISTKCVDVHMCVCAVCCSCAIPLVLNESLPLCFSLHTHVGVDCSINANDIHWKIVDTVVSPFVRFINESSSNVIDLELEPERLQRAGHSAVVWGDYMWVFGGYTFPLGKNSSEMDLEPLLWRCV